MNVNSNQQSVSFQKLIVKKKEIAQLGSKTTEAVIKAADNLKRTAKENPNLNIYLQKGNIDEVPTLEVMIIKGGFTGFMLKLLCNAENHKLRYSITNKLPIEKMNHEALHGTVCRTVAEFKKMFMKAPTQTVKQGKEIKETAKALEKELKKVF